MVPRWTEVVCFSIQISIKYFTSRTPCRAFHLFKTKQGQKERICKFHNINFIIWDCVLWGLAKRRKCHLSDLVYSSQLLISCKTLRRNHDRWLLCTIHLAQFYSRDQKMYWILPRKETAFNILPFLGRINNMLSGGRKAPYLLIVRKTVKSIWI